jgi:hypothetical protein
MLQLSSSCVPSHKVILSPTQLEHYVEVI